MFKVINLQGDTYQVIETKVIDRGSDWMRVESSEGEVRHQGSLTDCEAFIRLKEGGYL